MHAIAQGKPLPLGGISTNRRSVLGVTNLCDAILSVAGVRSDADLDSATVENNASPHQKSLVNTYHLDDGGVVSTRRLVELLAEGIGKRARLFNVPYWLAITAGTLLRKRDYVRRLYGDMETSSEAFRKDFQWQPKVGLEDGLRMMASHFIRSIRQAK
jgi:nucleoside-diphosphate-sugar epimerase